MYFLQRFQARSSSQKLSPWTLIMIFTLIWLKMIKSTIEFEKNVVETKATEEDMLQIDVVW